MPPVEVLAVHETVTLFAELALAETLVGADGSGAVCVVTLLAVEALEIFAGEDESYALTVYE